MTDDLPTWAACRDAVASGVATPIQRFIYNREPLTNAMVSDFREALSAAFAAARREGAREMRERAVRVAEKKVGEFLATRESCDCRAEARSDGKSYRADAASACANAIRALPDMPA